MGKDIDEIVGFSDDDYDKHHDDREIIVNYKKHDPKDLYETGKRFYGLLAEYSKINKKRPLPFGAKKIFEQKKATFEMLQARAEQEHAYLRSKYAFLNSELFKEFDAAYKSLIYVTTSQQTACTMFLMTGTYRPASDPFYIPELQAFSETLRLLDGEWKEFCKRHKFKA